MPVFDSIALERLTKQGCMNFSPDRRPVWGLSAGAVFAVQEKPEEYRHDHQRHRGSDEPWPEMACCQSRNLAWLLASLPGKRHALHIDVQLEVLLHLEFLGKGIPSPLNAHKNRTNLVLPFVVEISAPQN